MWREEREQVSHLGFTVTDHHLLFNLSFFYVIFKEHKVLLTICNVFATSQLYNRLVHKHISSPRIQESGITCKLE